MTNLEDSVKFAEKAIEYDKSRRMDAAIYYYGVKKSSVRFYCCISTFIVRVLFTITLSSLFCKQIDLITIQKL